MSDRQAAAVLGEHTGERLDVWLARQANVGRKRAQRAIEAGKVSVNEGRRRKSHVLSTGDRVEWDAFVPVTAIADPSVSLVIPHQDDAVVVVDKPAGVPSHPLEAEELGTVANALMARFPEMAGVGYGPREPGLVHRLDTDTSGLLLCARTAAVHQALRDDLLSGKIHKEYLALVQGHPVEGPIEGWLTSDPHHRARVVMLTEYEKGARRAVTEVQILERAETYALVKASAKVAARHQIRAQLAAIGHPLFGDRLYHGPSLEGLTRHFLHASRLRLAHPVTGEALDLHSGLPAELLRVMSG